MSNLELCQLCGSPTGKAGKYDDSIYYGPAGPLCDECADEVRKDACPEVVEWAESAEAMAEKLKAENERLKGLIKGAYSEGFLIGKHQDAVHLDTFWLESDARKALEGKS